MTRKNGKRLRLLSFVLAAVLCLSLYVVPAMADESGAEEGKIPAGSEVFMPDAGQPALPADTAREEEDAAPPVQEGGKAAGQEEAAVLPGKEETPAGPAEAPDGQTDTAAGQSADTAEAAQPVLSDGGTKTEAVRAFVTLLYQNFLGRQPDQAGLNSWTSQLVSGKKTAAEVVLGFYDSVEFQRKALGDRAFIEALYRTILGREPDSAGTNTWLGVLKKGFTRRRVLEGFLDSQEMKNKCAAMGVDPGEYFSPEIVDRRPEITEFVARMYSLLFGRSPDRSGLNNWVTGLADGRITGADVIWGFFASAELASKKLNHEAFIRLAYKAVLDREADTPGLNSWCLIAHRYSDLARVLRGFCGSSEYGKLCRRYGIAPGAIASSLSLRTAQEKYKGKVKAVALTFDDGPSVASTRVTGRILDTLAKYGAHATFFEVGEMVDQSSKTSEVMNRALQLGCTLGAHTYSHANLKKLSAPQITSEITRCVNAIRNKTGYTVNVMRLPGGNWNSLVKQTVNYPMIQWDVDTMDWSHRTASKTVAEIKRSTRPGSIILMHDLYGPTADAVEEIVPWLISQGYQLMTVQEMFAAYDVPLEAHKLYYSIIDVR